MGNEEYEVECILAEHDNKFLVKWVGWPVEDATWEVRSALGHCADILQSWGQRDQAALIRLRETHVKMEALQTEHALATASLTQMAEIRAREALERVELLSERDRLLVEREWLVERVSALLSDVEAASMQMEGEAEDPLPTPAALTTLSVDDVPRGGRLQAPAPSGWPDDVLFCSFPVQQGVEPQLVHCLRHLSEHMPGVVICEVDPAHPCFGTGFNRGLFATSSLEPGSTLGRYAGQVRTATANQERWRKSGLFAIALDVPTVATGARGALAPRASSGLLELDAERMGNEGRFINDYRNIRAAPNVQFRTAADRSVGVWVDIVVIAPISPGEEIVVDYGSDFRAIHRLKRSQGPRIEMPRRVPQTVCGRDGCRIRTPGGMPHGGLCAPLVTPSLRRKKRRR